MDYNPASPFVMQSKIKRVCIIGVGAVGGFLAAKIATSPQDLIISLVVRPKYAKTLREEGLIVLSGNQKISTKNFGVYESTSKILETQDLVFLAVKSPQLLEIAETLTPILNDTTVVVPLQNGFPWWYFLNYNGPQSYSNIIIKSVDPKGLLSTAISKERIIGSLVYFACSLEKTGVVRHIEGGRMPLGELMGNKSDRVQQVSQILKAAGLKSPVLKDIRSEIWLKLTGTLAFNPISALTHATLEELCTFPPTKELVHSMMKEAESIAKALGATIRLPLEKRIEGAARIKGHKTSMCQDIEKGRRTEIECVLGAVLELAELTSSNATNLKCVYACVKLLEFVVDRHHVSIKPLNRGAD